MEIIPTRNKVPEQINIIDLFHRSIYANADFDFVLQYLVEHNLARCESIYTIESISSQLLPRLTREALVSRNPVDIMKLYPGIIKLCIRRNRGLLVYIDFNTNKIISLRKREKFLDYVQLMPGVELKDIWLPSAEVLPNMRATRTKFKTEDEIRAAQQAYAAQAAEVKQAKKLQQLPNLQTPSASNGTTSIFQGGDINPVAVFINRFDLAAAGRLGQQAKFDDLLLLLFSRIVAANPKENINVFISSVANGLKSFGIADFCQMLQETSGDIMYAFRQLYNLPEGDGTSNQKFIDASRFIWEGVTKQPLTSVVNRDDLTLYNTVVQYLEAQQRQEAAQEASNTPNDVMNDLSNASLQLRSSISDTDDIII